MAQAGLELTPRQAEQFWIFHQFLREQNETLNMTRIFEFDAMVLKLYIDSALVGKLTALPSPLLDIGTGPGFPGIPLAILHPEVQFLLSEGRHQRNRFLQQSVDRLGLRNVEVLGHRIAPDYDRSVQGIITRAVETIPETLQRVMRCLLPGGKAIFMKGPECDEEIAQAEKRYARWYITRDDIHYRLPESDHARRLVVFERTETEAPRPVAAPQITSADNPRFRQWKSLLTSRGIRKEGRAIASGRAALEILGWEPDAVEQVILREGMKTLPELVGHDATVLSRELFAALDEDGTQSPLVVVRVSEPGSAPPWPARALVLGLQEPAELGRTLRAATALGWKDAVLLEEAAHPFHPRALREAGAALWQITLHRGPRAASVPPDLQGGVRLEGPGAELGPERGHLRVFLGPQDTPGWPGAGQAADLALEAAVLLASAQARKKG